MTEQEQLPDAHWCGRMGTILARDDAYRAAIEEIGSPLFVKLKESEGERFVILRFGVETPPENVRLHPDGHVSEEGVIVSTDVDTWGRLLRGATDLTTAVMGRDVRASGSMFRLMRIADPAERLVQAVGRAARQATGGAE